MAPLLGPYTLIQNPLNLTKAGAYHGQHDTEAGFLTYRTQAKQFMIREMSCSSL